MTDRFIESDPGGQPVIAGTQVTVEAVLKELAAWGDVDRILTAHPELDRKAVQAALAFAAEKVHSTASVQPEHPPLRERLLSHRRTLAENCLHSEKRPWKNSAPTTSRS